METLERTYPIPSNGLFGGPKEITLRAMTTREEKILLSTRDFSVFDRLIKSCCVEPKELDTDLLHQNDIMYLTYVLRDLTFGNTYTQEINCPECGFKQEIEVDISDMEINILNVENIEDRLKVTLPVSGDTLQLKLLSNGDNKRITKMIKTKTAKGRLQDPKSYEYTVRLMETIVTKNDEDFENSEAKRNYVDTLNMKDLIAIQNTLKDIDFGIDNSIVVTCLSCLEDIEVNGLICPEFFRPTK